MLCSCLAHATPPSSRYDYEGVESEMAYRMMNHVREVIKHSPTGTKFGAFELQLAGMQSLGAGGEGAGWEGA